VSRLEQDGHRVVLTVRDHAQTLELARGRWPRFRVVGSASPPGRLPKVRAIARRAEALRRFAREQRPDLAFSHGSYAQLLAARATGVRGVTMMDYEHQPANHLSFRLAERVIVPAAFPEGALRRFGVPPARVVRYPGFKEELYLAAFRPDRTIADRLGLDERKVIAVMRPPPEGALYHRMANERFDALLELAAAHPGVQAVLLPRTPTQADRYRREPRIRVLGGAVDGPSLLAVADLVIGAGGTMNRESAVLGTPTYTVFAGDLAAVDAELIRLGRMHDLRNGSGPPPFEKKRSGATAATARAEPIVETILGAMATAVGEGSPHSK
jgi:predicted glycosyltransferase